MKYIPTHFIAAKDCPFTYKGQNLTELRRVKLRQIAKSLEIESNGPKNEILGLVINRLRAMESDSEITAN